MLRAVFIALMVFSASPGVAQEEITLTIRDVIERPALMTRASDTSAAVLAHQAGRGAESWTPFSLWLAQSGVSSLALSSVSSEDVAAGAAHLRANGFDPLYLIGASRGGAAVQTAFAEGATEGVSHIVLFGTASGKPLKDKSVAKLFLGSEDDFFHARVTQSFAKAAAPQVLVVMPGAAHGQDLLDSPHNADISNQIAFFLKLGEQ